MENEKTAKPKQVTKETFMIADQFYFQGGKVERWDVFLGLFFL